MKTSEPNGHIDRIRREYADTYGTMKWLSPEGTGQAVRKREALLNAIFGHTGPEWGFSRTKLYTHAISPGCALCGSGEWACLFINNICNARCFYCPSAQTEAGPPMTSTVAFDNAPDFADYVRRFRIRGVSFSGGEPLMSFDRVLDYLKALRSRVEHSLHIWMYTNGILVTEDKLKALRDNGLDEIRFDLSATGYPLDGVRLASGIIPVVTVEIPAVPEDLGKTSRLIPQLYESGVNYLNLHQIRCTRFNSPRLIKRGYTFLHGPGVTVLETELAALELILSALEQDCPLPVNYCAFTYRHQYQRAGNQRRTAPFIKAPHEDVTGTGQIRTLSAWGEPDRISAVAQKLTNPDVDPDLWQMPKKRDHLLFASDVWPRMDFTGLRLKVAYSGTALRPSVSFRHPFKEVALNNRKKVVVEKFNRHPGLWFEGGDIDKFGSEFIHTAQSTPEQLPPDLIRELNRFESFEPGLADYY